jgi:hypothetical protein
MTSTPNGNGKTFLDFPTQKGLKTAFLVIIVFMVLAGVLYFLGGKKPEDYITKVGDTFIQGAIVSILFAILKAKIDKAPLWRVVWPWDWPWDWPSGWPSKRQQQHAPAAPSAPTQ